MRELESERVVSHLPDQHLLLMVSRSAFSYTASHSHVGLFVKDHFVRDHKEFYLRFFLFPRILHFCKVDWILPTAPVRSWGGGWVF